MENSIGYRGTSHLKYVRLRQSLSRTREYVDDLTPESEYDKLKITREANYEVRTAGIGRPTKKERRMIEKLKKSRF